MAEQWRPIEGWIDYEVSDLGRVRSRDRVTERNCRPRWLRGKVLKGEIRSKGYPSVVLCDDRERVKRSVHRLVLEAFVGPCPPEHECRHLDGDRENTRLENLAWGTRAENNRDKLDHGTHNRGERHSMAKLTEDDVREIRAALASGETHRSIAARFGVAEVTVWSVANGDTWGWLE